MTNDYYKIETIDTSYRFDIHLPSKAQLMIRFKNFSPTVDSDYFSVTPRFETYGSNGYGIKMHDQEGVQKNT